MTVKLSHQQAALLATLAKGQQPIRSYVRSSAEALERQGYASILPANQDRGSVVEITEAGRLFVEGPK